MGIFSIFSKKEQKAVPSTQEVVNKNDSNKMADVEPNESSVNLIKQRVDLIKKVSLEKNIPETQKSRVALVLDYSGSMGSLYRSGFVQRLLERLMPLGIRFDDNEAIDVFIFHNDAYYIGEVGINGFTNFVKREIESKYSMGGTSYSPIINQVVDKFTKEKGDVAYVMFVADGDCHDKEKATKAIKKASKHGIFWQFIGIGGASMDFLENLDDMGGRKVDNANFFQVNDLETMSDKDLYSKMMDEYPQYLIEAKKLNII